MHNLLKLISIGANIAAGVYVLLLATFAMQLPKSEDLDLVEQVDGIVVFTGGSNRIETALSLLQDGYDVPILISGVNPSVSENKLLKNLSQHKQNLVTLDYKSLSTSDNAQMALLWANAHNVQKIGLITSHYHMPRSLYNLERYGVQKPVFPLAVFPEKMPISFMVREFHKYILTRLHII